MVDDRTRTEREFADFDIGGKSSAHLRSLLGRCRDAIVDRWDDNDEKTIALMDEVDDALAGC